MTTILAITDLGPGNKGKISAADVNPAMRAKIIQAIGESLYKRSATKRFRCVDGRAPQGGLQTPEGMADPQEAGGAAISEAAADLMGEHPLRLSELVAANTKTNIDNGYEVVVHGDDQHGKEGCGANKHLRAVLLSNAENQQIVAPKAWVVSQALGLDRWLNQTDIMELIAAGKRSAEDDKLWDAGPGDVVDIAVKNGALYEELIEEHMERLVIVDTSDSAFDEEQFMADHLQNGSPIEAFVASIGSIRAKLFNIAQKTGQTERDAALKTLGVTLFNIGVPKELTAEASAEQPNAALPVVILG